MSDTGATQSLTEFDLSVLIVSNDSKMGRGMARYLLDRGVDTRAIRGDDAVEEHLASHLPQIVFLDVNVPQHRALHELVRASTVRPSLVVLARSEVQEISTGDWPRLSRGTEGLLRVPFRGTELRRELLRVAEARTRTGRERVDARVAVPAATGASVAYGRPVASSTLPQGRDGHVSRPGQDSRSQSPSTRRRTIARSGVTFDTDFEHAGSLAETPMARVVCKVLAQRLTGVLEIRDGDRSRSLYFLRGEPVGATSPNSDDMLGAVLVRMGLVSLIDLRRTLDLADTELPIGQVLLQWNIITADQLMEALDKQTYQRMVGAFACRTQPYVFREGRTWLDGITPRHQNPIRILLEGMHRFIGQNEMATSLADRLGYYVRRTPRFDHYEPFFIDVPGLVELVGLIDGRRTLGEVISEAPDRALEILQLVFAFGEAKLLVLSQAAPSSGEDTGSLTIPPESPTTGSNVIPRPAASPSRQATLSFEDEGDSGRPRPLLPSTLIAGRYLVKGVLGEGATSVVYRAYDTELDEPVAIKVLTLGKVQPEFVSRFKQELSVARQLAHPNVVRVYDIGSTPDGLKFISMELLEGDVLRSKMKGPMPLREAVTYLIQAARGLEVAHEFDIVHRDIKPENLFVTTDDVIKVMDFGIAKKLASTTTRIGFSAGTPTYMAPEQIRSFSSVTRASDLYSLGIVAYELLVGRPPFQHERLEGLLQLHLECPAPRIRTQRPQVPLELEAVVLRLLDKDPALRIGSCRELARLLDNLLQLAL